MSEDPRIQSMYGKMNHLKNRNDVTVDYLTAQEYEEMLWEEASEEGMRIGIQQGIQQTKITVICEMLLDHQSYDKIIKYTGASEAEIKLAEESLTEKAKAERNLT